MACLCDFCSAPDAGWRHPARSFIGYVAPGVVGESLGDWAACQECYQLIMSGNREDGKVLGDVECSARREVEGRSDHQLGGVGTRAEAAPPRA